MDGWGVVRLEQTKSAAGDLISAALLGKGWESALQRLADSAGAGGASLVRVQAGRRPLAHISSTGWAASEDLMLAGQAPPSERQFYPDNVFGHGFRGDHDVWSDDELRRDPYYQEFLRPRGVFFHAKVRLWSQDDERLSLTLKRRLELGPYEPADIACLDAILPELKATFRIAQRVLDAQAEGLAQPLQKNRDLVFELDAFGRVLRIHGEGTLRSELLVRNGRLAAAERSSQPALDRAVAAAVRPPQRSAVAPLDVCDGQRSYVQCIPVVGDARDVFLATAAIAVVILARVRPNHRGLDPTLLRDAFRFTDREAQLAALLCEGLDLPESARRLRIDVGTARNHLKSAFIKSDTHRQGELVALLSRFRC